MKIVIDARFYGLQHTGLGRYTVNLIHELAKLDHKNQYYLLLHQSVFSQFEKTRNFLPDNFHPVLAEARHYSLKEQLLLPRILRSIQPDLLHVPHFNIPVFYRGKLIVTIHDLIKHQSVGPQTSTLPAPIYWFKHQVYRQVFRTAVNHASAILVPSQFVKQQLISNFETRNSKLETKIHITYEAPDKVYYQPSTDQQTTKKILSKYRLSQPYLIYTGNAYPHKNLENLVRALAITNFHFSRHPEEKPKRRRRIPSEPDPTSAGDSSVRFHRAQNDARIALAIVSARNIFLNRLKSFVTQQGLQDHVKFLGFVPDPDLCQLYRHSLAFITPSLHEGFGLPGLEAMAAGTPVLSSNASCLPEVYAGAATYFNPHRPQAIADQILKVTNLKPSQRKTLISRGLKHSKQFSWAKLAEQTLDIYQAVRSHS
jgi:glycosyltransferase involved in cell wall biosynthesis